MSEKSEWNAENVTLALLIVLTIVLASIVVGLLQRVDKLERRLDYPTQQSPAPAQRGPQ